VKVKVTKAGFEGYTGYLGRTKFEDGISEDIPKIEADRIAIVMPCEVVSDDGELFNEEIQNRDIEAPVKAPMEKVSEEELEEGKKVASEKAAAKDALGKAPVPEKLYTEEELEEIADKKGITALREIADPMGVSDRSIAGLITEILAEQERRVELAKAAEA
jgi:hypothetical protein